MAFLPDHGFDHFQYIWGHVVLTDTVFYKDDVIVVLTFFLFLISQIHTYVCVCIVFFR